MTQENKRHLALSGAYNFRDLGGYRTRSGATTKWRRIIRADSPHRLSKQDIDKLLGQGLTSVIDMRSNNEIKSAPNPFAVHSRVNYQNIGLFDHLAPNAMPDDNRRPSNDPLLDFYVTTLANRQSAIRDVLNAIATAQKGAVMFHCTAGKDRTGLISALLLGLVEVKEEEIISDYVQTKPLITELVREFLELAKRNGADLTSYRPLLECNPDTMRKVMQHIKDRYNSVPDFLTEIGLQPISITLLKTRLLS